MILSQVDITSLRINDPIISQKGAKSCPITFQDGSPVRVKLSESALRSPYGLSSWEPGANRVNLDLSITDANLADHISQIDSFILSLILENTPKFLGKEISPLLADEMFKKSLTHNNKDYPPTLRTKVTVGEGSKQVRVWDEEKRRRTIPDDARNCDLEPVIIIKSVWQMGSAFGLVWECTDLLIRQEAEECPF